MNIFFIKAFVASNEMAMQNLQRQPTKCATKQTEQSIFYEFCFLKNEEFNCRRIHKASTRRGWSRVKCSRTDEYFGAGFTRQHCAALCLVSSITPKRLAASDSNCHCALPTTSKAATKQSKISTLATVTLAKFRTFRAKRPTYMQAYIDSFKWR